MPESESKLRLLDAAERLLAEHGFDRVSVRDVSSAVGANVAAVNYHFGSREGMIARVISRCISPLLEERNARLETLERRWGSKPVPLEELLDAYLRPILASGRKTESGEPVPCRLVGRILGLPHDELPADVAFQLKVSSDRLKKMLSKSLSGLSQEELQWRVHFIEGGLIHLLAGHEGWSGVQTPGAVVAEPVMGRFVRFASAGLKEGMELGDTPRESPQGFFPF